MITNKWLWILVTILLVLAVGFTTMFLLYPEKLGLQTAKEEAAYETELFDKNELPL